VAGWELEPVRAGRGCGAGGVVLLKVFGQDLAQMVLIDDQQPVEEPPLHGTDNSLADRVRSVRLRRLARILMPAAVNTASKDPVNWSVRSLTRNLTEAARWPRSIGKSGAACAVHAPSGVGGDVGHLKTASVVLDDDQGT
jgi:hypothetical protein